MHMGNQLVFERYLMLIAILQNSSAMTEAIRGLSGVKLPSGSFGAE